MMSYSFNDHLRFMQGLEPEIIEGPFKVFTRDRFMGTIPSMPVRSTSGIFDVRPGDFKLVERGGERVVEANPMIGPGDFACIGGFVPADHLPADFMDRSMATAFDAATARGASRTQAVGAVISEALSSPRKARP